MLPDDSPTLRGLPEDSPVPTVSPELPTRTWRFLLALLGRLPQRGLSRSFGRLADIPIPVGLRPLVLGTFARSVGIDLSEAEKPIEAYDSLNTFFVRRLKPGSRVWPASDEVISSPVDGVVGRFGRVERGLAVQAKGHAYSVAELLGDEVRARSFESGSFLTLYLSPRHYHRIHTPAAGVVTAAVHIPGSLYPVNAPAVKHVPRLFARNERVVTHLGLSFGDIAVVAVGAYNVGRISVAFDEEWGDGKAIAGQGRHHSPSRTYAPGVPVGKGAEIMAFHLGSTVVLLFQPGVELLGDLILGQEVRVGEVIATSPKARGGGG